MRKPEIGTGRLRAVCAWIVTVSNRWWIKYFVKPFLIALPVTLFALAGQEENIAKSLTSVFGFDVKQVLERYELIAVVIIFMASAFIDGLFSLVEKYSQPDRQLSRDDVMAMLTAINHVTGDKAQRFAAEAKRFLRAAPTNGATVFNAITKPEQQLGLLVTAVHGIFELLDQKSNYRVGLIRVKNGKPFEWTCFHPPTTPPKTPAPALAVPQSTVMRSIKAKKAVLVSDVANELERDTKAERRYCRGSHRPGDQGSQLCYPLVHASSGEIEYVLTIAGNQGNCMPEEHLPLYEWVIEPFALRINLEHSLILVKEHVTNDQPRPPLVS